MATIKQRLENLELHVGTHRRRWYLWVSTADQPDLYSGAGGERLTASEIDTRYPGDVHTLIAGVADDDDPGDEELVEP